MELRRFIHSGIAASAIGHLSVLAGILILAEVHPFGSVTAEPVSVDIVTPAEAPPPPKIEEAPPPKDQPSDSFDLASKPQASSPPPPAAPQEAATPPQQQPTPSKPRPDRKQAAAEPPQPKPEPSTLPQTATLSPSPAPLPALPAPAPPTAPPSLVPQQPDVSVKYHVLLGLPNDRISGFDSQAYKTADVDQSNIAAFRRHLKTCSTLPKSIAPTDAIKIMLRVSMTPDGKLAAEPILVEASASAKGPFLMQSAINALQACQPYQMLPADRYGEWKVLDLTFTPQDFTGAS